MPTDLECKEGGLTMYSLLLDMYLNGMLDEKRLHLAAKAHWITEDQVKQIISEKKERDKAQEEGARDE